MVHLDVSPGEVLASSSQLGNDSVAWRSPAYLKAWYPLAPSIDAVDQRPQPSAIEHSAERAGGTVRYSGGVFYLGTLYASDRAVLVRRVRRLDFELECGYGVTNQSDRFQVLHHDR